MPAVSPNASSISGIFIHRTADMIASFGPLGFSAGLSLSCPRLPGRYEPMHGLRYGEVLHPRGSCESPMHSWKSGISGPARSAEVPGEVADHVARVVLDAVNERRLAPPQHRQAERVQARAVGDHAAVMAQAPLAVDHGHVEPAVLGPEAGGPHDRTDLTAPQVKL